MRDEAAENDESYKQEMKNQNRVCEKPIGHLDMEICLACPTVINQTSPFLYACRENRSHGHAK
ncbi:hypothetical protein TPL01_18620 [Sulfuriferula plumbiphila]|uniref:Uncharacterized protein n=1 Tax=Sulfuriferula plumbiphila TaxID=171865 RepID=A0A512L8B3_9PROT|nr:hypothetical protein SFPGR_24860 [Sulfuriferula plumbiphila]GEP30724.1 hypothetical protein TPL01_18620 [Sulfuriferula plumbiphila]